MPDESNAKTLNELCKATGVPAPRLVLAVKEGFIPKAGRGLYPLGAAIKGLYGFYESHWGALPNYDNVEQCSAETRIPVSVIKAVRKRTKEPFAGRGVSLKLLLRSMFDGAEGSEGEDDYRLMEIKYRALGVRDQTQKRMGLSADKAEVSAAIAEAVSAWFFAFDRLAEVEAPAALVGLTEVQIQQWLARAGDRMKAQLREKLDRAVADAQAAAVAEKALGAAVETEEETP